MSEVQAVATRPSYQDWNRSGRGSGWMYLGGAATIIAVWLFGTFILILPALIALGTDVVDSGSFSLGESWKDNFVALVTFLPFFFATPIVVWLYHGRPWRTIVTPFTKINIGIIVKGAALWGGLMALSVAVTLPFVDEKPEWSFEPVAFASNLVIVLVLLFFQTTAEELFFRGYLASWISLRLRNIWVQSSIIGVLFMLPHLGNPEVTSLSGWTLVLASSTYFMVGFGWMFVTINSGTLEIAIGAHFINNFLVTMVLGPADSSLGGASLWVSDVGFTAWDALSTLIMIAIFIGLARFIKPKGEVVPVLARKTKPAQNVYPAQAYPTPGYSYPIPAYPTPAYPTLAYRTPAYPAGWYSDPWQQAVYRYWNGSFWTRATYYRYY